MPRERFQTLTEQMFYILLCLNEECCGMDIMNLISEMTDGRVKVGPGTLYHLLEQFQQEDMIRQTKVEGRRRSYRLTPIGEKMLAEEYARLQERSRAYERVMRGEMADGQVQIPIGGLSCI